ncbi:unnamed protein product, partial [Fusarium fujikuroi]
PQEIESFITALLVKQTPSLFKSPPSTHYDIIVQNEASFHYDPAISGSRRSGNQWQIMIFRKLDKVGFLANLWIEY